MAIETISVLDAAGATKTVLADLIGSDYGQVLKVAFGSDGSLTLVDASNGLPISVVGTASVKTTRAATGTRSNVAASATDVLLLAANANRISAVVYNDSTAILYVGIGTTTVTSSSFSFKLDAGGVYEDYDFTGQIRGMWASATGNARITEKT
jgi:hypothetical protein